MTGFTEVENSIAVLLSQGNYVESQVYVLQSHLFAKWGTKYIQLYRDGKTSILGLVSWIELDVPFKYHEEDLGPLTTKINSNTVRKK